MKALRSPCWVLVVFALAVGTPAAGDDAPPPAAGAGDAPVGSHEHDSAHGGHRHHVSLLLGGVDNSHLDERALAFGAGYRYALSERFAAGPSIDFASYDHEDATLLIVAAYWKPVANLLLFAGPGVEYIDAKGHHDAGHASRSAAGESGSGNATEFASRVGAGYEFHAGRITVMPLVAADFVDGHTTMLLAVDLGLGF